jgi:hypothetical protein
MALISSVRNLFIPRKATTGKVGQPDYGTDMRAIEKWANSIPITELVAGSNITLTPSNGQGSTVEIAASGGGGGGGYASITGPGTSSPTGTLTQGGAWIVNNDITVNGVSGTAQVTIAGVALHAIAPGGTSLGIDGTVFVNGAFNTNGSGEVNLQGLDWLDLLAGATAVANEAAEVAVNGSGSVGSNYSLGSIAFRGNGRSSSTPPVVEFFFITAAVSPPSFVPSVGGQFGFAFSTNGHIYYWDTSSWHLVA